VPLQESAHAPQGGWLRPLDIHLDQVDAVERGEVVVQPNGRDVHGRPLIVRIVHPAVARVVRIQVQPRTPGPVRDRETGEGDIAVAVRRDVLLQESKVPRLRFESEDTPRGADAPGEDQRVIADVGPDVEDHLPWPELGPRALRREGLVNPVDGQFSPVLGVQAHAVAEDVRHVGAERSAHEALGGADDPKAGEPVARQAPSGGRVPVPKCRSRETRECRSRHRSSRILSILRSVAVIIF
jgi:hypothetical protein